MRSLAISAANAALVLAIPAAPAFAQQKAATAQAGKLEERVDPDAQDKTVSLAFSDGDIAQLTGGPNDRSLKSTRLPSFQLTSTNSDTELSAAFSSQISGGAGKFDPNSRRVPFSYGEVSIKGTVPLQNGNSTEQLFGLKSLPAGTAVTVGFTQFWGMVNRPPWEAAGMQVALRNCTISYPDIDDPKNPGQKKPSPQCDRNDPDAPSDGRFIELYNYAGLRHHLASIFPRPIMFAGLEGSGSSKDFDVADAATAALGKQSKFSYRGTIYAGLVFPTTVASLSASFSYLREYEAGAPVTVCQPMNAAQCVTGPGTPNVKTRAVGAIEGRYAFGFHDGKPAQFAIAPEASYDFTHDAFSVDVPLFFSADGEGKLSGGIRLTYVNEKVVGSAGRRDNTTVSMFVGVPFSLFGKLFN